MVFFVCPVCHCKDFKYFGIKNNVYYCRRCIKTIRSSLAERKSYNSSNIKATLSYKLTRSQQIASEEIFKHVINNNNVLVNAVCGAGKTELVYKCLDYYLSNGKIVGFAIPRKDVVIEIYNRLKKDYHNVRFRDM